MAALGLALAAEESDRVTSLPMMGDFDFNLYSGYLKIPDSSKSLHYMFAQS